MTVAEPELGQAEASQPVLVDDANGVRVVTINRPHVRNAIDLAAAEAIDAALEEFERADDLRVLVVTGAGGTFCSGMDLNAYLRGERPSTPAGGFAGLVERRLAKPLIAAVEGAAVAGGFEIALACDMIVASATARFGLPEVKRGLVPAGGGLLRLPERLPRHRAMELALTGAPISAETAGLLGLINRLTPAGEALPVALDLAAEIVANGPLAVMATKAILVESPGWAAEEAFDRQREISEPVRRSQDAREGAQAFLAKRPAQWQGR